MPLKIRLISPKKFSKISQFYTRKAKKFPKKISGKKNCQKKISLHPTLLRIPIIIIFPWDNNLMQSYAHVFIMLRETLLMKCALREKKGYNTPIVSWTHFFVGLEPLFQLHNWAAFLFFWYYSLRPFQGTQEILFQSVQLCPVSCLNFFWGGRLRSTWIISKEKKTTTFVIIQKVPFACIPPILLLSIMWYMVCEGHTIWRWKNHSSSPSQKFHCP